MSAYATACEFYAKADCEGGLAEMVLGYGVSAEDVPDAVATAAQELENAFKRFKNAVGEWHEQTCVDGEGEFPCPWG